MLRILSPEERSYITPDAQAIIYEYRSKKWLSPAQIEDLITQLLIFAHLKEVQINAEVLTAFLRSAGNTGASPLPLDYSAVLPDLNHIPS